MLNHKTRASFFALTLAAIAMGGTAPRAYADVWMVKSSGALGCKDREALLQLGGQGAKSLERTPPAGCVVLYSGERLLDDVEAGAGFSGTLKVERANGSKLYVSSSDVVADPGIGSVMDNRDE